MTRSHRKYVLLGNLYVKYFGKVTAESFYPGGQDFDIEVYEAILSEASIVEERNIEALSEGQHSVPLYIPDSIVIQTVDDEKQFVVSGRQVRLISPKMELVSEESLETFGELKCRAFFEVDQSSFVFNPIQAPTSQTDVAFPGFLRVEPGRQFVKEKPKPIDLGEILSTLFLVFGVVLVGILSFYFFSLFHPAILLGMLGIAILWAGWSFIIPEAFRKVTQAILLPIFQIVAGLISFFFFFSLLSYLLPYLANAWGFALLLFLIFIVISYLLSNWRRILYGGLGLGAILFILYLPIGWSNQEWNPRKVENRSYQPVVSSVSNSDQVVQVEKEGTDTLRNTISWIGPQQEMYTVNFVLYEDDVSRSKSKRKAINQQIQENQDFATVFQLALLDESQQVSSFLDGLDSIRSVNNMTDVYFQDVIVHLVQQIPYVQVMQESCNNVDFACVPYVKYGFYTPTEFLYHFRGDCDTKSLLLFSIFDHFNYDIALLGSLIYQHAMVAVPSDKVNLDYPIRIGNDVFYPWESTASGWQVGQMPPTVDKLDYWDVLLIAN